MQSKIMSDIFKCNLKIAPSGSSCCAFNLQNSRGSGINDILECQLLLCAGVIGKPLRSARVAQSVRMKRNAYAKALRTFVGDTRKHGNRLLQAHHVLQVTPTSMHGHER